jgi:hypothetical protein
MEETPTMRKIILGLVAATAVAAPLVMAAPANAYTANADGTTSVTKGEVQTALGWNNGDFDANVGKAKDVKFVVAGERVNVDYPMVCMNLTTGDMSTVGHRLIVQPGTNISATQTLSGNGKQINGWTLTAGAVSDFAPSGNAVVRDTGCADGALVMNTGTASQPLTVTATGGGVSVKGVNKTGASVTVPLVDTTPVVVPAA